MPRQKTTQPRTRKAAKRKTETNRQTAIVLLDIAHQMRAYAYVPYSKYRVGAALLSTSGNVYGGCNVENASYGLSICAERTAYVKAVSEGDTAFAAIAVVTDDGGTPCGACRQFMSEFGFETVVFLGDKHGKYQTTTVGALLPDAFVLKPKARKRA